MDELISAIPNIAASINNKHIYVENGSNRVDVYEVPDHIRSYTNDLIFLCTYAYFLETIYFTCLDEDGQPVKTDYTP